MSKKPKIRVLRPDEKVKTYDREKADHGVLRRTVFLMVFCGVLLFLPLIWQLFRLMILDHEKYETSAIDNQTRSTPVSAVVDAVRLSKLSL